MKELLLLPTQEMDPGNMGPSLRSPPCDLHYEKGLVFTEVQLRITHEVGPLMFLEY